MTGDRARVRASDAIAAATVVVAGAATAPVFYDLLDVGAQGSLTAILLQMVVPSIFIAVAISVGVSGVRDLGGGA